MADWAKIAIKTGLIVLFTAGIVALFVGITFPVISLSQDVIQGIAFAKGVVLYWIPGFPIVFTLAMAVIGFRLGSYLFMFAVQAAKWLMKVNE